MSNVNYVRVTKPHALAELLRADLTKYVPWLSLWHYHTAALARRYPEQDFFRGWRDMMACLAMAEHASGPKIVVSTQIGPPYRLPDTPIAWDYAYYDALHDYALERASRLTETWSEAKLSLDTELHVQMEDEVIPLDFIAGLDRYDYYEPVYFTKDHQDPHNWWEHLLGPPERANRVAPVYHRAWTCPPGYIEQRYTGKEYGWSDHKHDPFLDWADARNVLISAEPNLEVDLCQRIRERG